MTVSNQTTDAMPVVYVAGPYSADSLQGVFDNIRNGIEACEQLIMYGFAPICPWHDFVYLLRSRKSTADLKYVSMAQLRKSDAVFVVTSGSDYRRSVGTMAEIAEANRLGIPVFYGPDGLDGSDGLLEWRNNKWVAEYPEPRPETTEAK